MTDQADPTQQLWPCPNCKAQIPGTSQFCPNCGHRLAAGAEPEAAKAEKKPATKGQTAIGCLMLIGLLLVIGFAINTLINRDGTSAPGDGAGARTPVAAAAWTRDRVVADLRSEGFSGSESQLADGTPRWLGQGPNSAIAEVTGPPNNVSKITLTVVASEEAGGLMGRFLNTYAPGSRQFFTDTLSEYSGQDLQRSRRFGDVTVSIQTLTVSDGALVLTSVSR